MDPKLLADLLRLGLGALSAVREWRAHASPSQLKAFVEAVHANGGTVDLATVDKALGDAQTAQEALEQQIADAGG